MKQMNYGQLAFRKLLSFRAIIYFYNTLTNKHEEIYNYCYSQTQNNFIFEVLDLVTEIVDYDEEKLEKVLSDCIDKFQKIKYLQLRDEFEVKTTLADEEVINTLHEKLQFVRDNVKKNRKQRYIYYEF